MGEALSGMAQVGGARQPMDRSALEGLVNASADYTSHAISHPRFSAPANDPAFFPVARPQNVLMGENGGARFGIRVQVSPPIMPEAGPTTANGRLVGPKGRSGSFWDQ
jgi:hypothetical protein